MRPEIYIDLGRRGGRLSFRRYLRGDASSSEIRARSSRPQRGGCNNNDNMNSSNIAGGGGGVSRNDRKRLDLSFPNKTSLGAIYFVVKGLVNTEIGNKIETHVIRVARIYRGVLLPLFHSPGSCYTLRVARSWGSLLLPPPPAPPPRLLARLNFAYAARTSFASTRDNSVNFP